MMFSVNKAAAFNGEGDVNKFITKCELDRATQEKGKQCLSVKN